MRSDASVETCRRRSLAVMPGLVRANGSARAAPAPGGGPDAAAASPSSLRAAASFQSAMKIWGFLSAVRLLAQASRLPSGLNTGSPSKPGLSVTRTGWCRPAASTK